jgi:hypothetical protein
MCFDSAILKIYQFPQRPAPQYRGCAERGRNTSFSMPVALSAHKHLRALPDKPNVWLQSGGGVKAVLTGRSIAGSTYELSTPKEIFCAAKS